ncbi:MAG: YraN family protein [Aureispira sp.]
MANHNDLGNLGERLAEEYLQGLGYSIIAQNWQWGKAEVDLIAYDRDILVFVEVKTRRRATFGPPELAVTSKKQRLLYDLATEYMYQITHEQEFRFDVIAILIEPTITIQHFPDAFFPNWMSNTDF